MPLSVDRSPSFGLGQSPSSYVIQTPLRSLSQDWTPKAEIRNEFAGSPINDIELFGQRQISTTSTTSVVNLGYRIGSFSMAGAKPHHPNWQNQDSYLEMNLADGRLFLGVFDGHGPDGTHISNRVKSLFSAKASEIASQTDLTEAFVRAFAEVQNEIQRDSLSENSGATTTVALINTLEHRACVAHVGDSTALLVDAGGRVVFQSRDHKPSDVDEAARLLSNGSTVINGRLHMNGRQDCHFGLARSIGDFAYASHGVNAEPDIADDLHFEPGSALILASDGVWDMVHKEEVGSSMLERSPQAAATSIVTAARGNWQTMANHIDDITAVIVKSPAEAESHSEKTSGYLRMMLDGSYASRSTQLPESPLVSESSGSGNATPVSCGGTVGLEWTDFVARLRLIF